jgi:hypothetical protein
MAPAEVDRVVTKMKRVLDEEARDEAERVKQQHERVSAKELLDKAKQHSGHSGGGAPGLTIPPEVLAAQPDLAFEQARLMIARLFMIRSAQPDAKRVEDLFADPSRASAQDLALWQALSRADRSGSGA